MKGVKPLAVAVAVASAALLFTLSGRALAVETAADIETDHIDAGDDGGPRGAAVLVRPFVLALGQLGADLEVAAGESASVTVEGDWLAAPGIAAYAAAAGIAWFPQRFAFRGLYVHPRVEWASTGAAENAGSGSSIGAAVTVGYEWTAPIGATLRAGGGVSCAASLGAGGPLAVAIEGVRPRVDLAVGWVL
jgi:hypothetical protein